MKITLIGYNNILKSIYLAARTCYKSEGLSAILSEFYLDKEKAYKLLNSIIKNNHTSVLEHAYFQFYLSGVSRSFLAQLSRHRTGISITVKSQHYINHSDFEYKELETDNKAALKIYNKAMSMLNTTYKTLIDVYNIPHYIAREVLPNSATVNILMTINLRELVHIMNLRLNKQNTPEIRLVFKEIYLQLKTIEPEVFKILSDNYGWENDLI